MGACAREPYPKPYLSSMTHTRELSSADKLTLTSRSYKLYIHGALAMMISVQIDKLARFVDIDGCPLQPGANMQKVVQLRPTLGALRDRRGLALDAQLKRQETTLASTTLLLDPEQRDAFGIVVSYSVKVKLYLGALGGELSAELPFILMHPKEGRNKLIQADSEADVEMFRQDTVLHQESVEVY
ncbi:unnamed protein product [Euphydryas editha]|uniref:Arrestin C-terminal-like domain-containing protein n=1 Tax=Euphydryas editha TaxID=104508 RepID=A0AAU9UZV9_EUPED|nr:unnamed protein product [Euphydryas editha]